MTYTKGIHRKVAEDAKWYLYFSFAAETRLRIPLRRARRQQMKACMDSI